MAEFKIDSSSTYYCPKCETPVVSGLLFDAKVLCPNCKELLVKVGFKGIASSQITGSTGNNFVDHEKSPKKPVENLKKFLLSGNGFVLSLKILPIFAILAYFSGWSYVNEYFSEFGINRSTIAFSDYTTFLHSFSVALIIPELFTSIDFLKDFLKSIWLILLILCIVLFIMFKKNYQFESFQELLILRILILLLVLISINQVSKGAGLLDAKRVIDGENIRAVNLYFSKSFYEDLSDQTDEAFARGRINSIVEAAEYNALGLLWRNSNESIFLRYSLVGGNKGDLQEVIRISNKYITSIFNTTVSERK